MLLEPTEPAPDTEPEPEPPLSQRTTSAEELRLQRKRKPAKKKGVGYGVDGHGDSSWNVEAKVLRGGAYRALDNLAFSPRSWMHRQTTVSRFAVGGR